MPGGFGKLVGTIKARTPKSVGGAGGFGGLKRPKLSPVLRRFKKAASGKGVSIRPKLAPMKPKKPGLWM